MTAKKNYNWIWQTAIVLGISALVGYFSSQAQTADSINTVDSNFTEKVNDVNGKLDVHIAEAIIRDTNTQSNINEMKGSLNDVGDKVGTIVNEQVGIKKDIIYIKDDMAELKQQQKENTEKILEAIKNGG